MADRIFAGAILAALICWATGFGTLIVGTVTGDPAFWFIASCMVAALGLGALAITAALARFVFTGRT